MNEFEYRKKMLELRQSRYASRFDDIKQLTSDVIAFMDANRLSPAQFAELAGVGYGTIYRMIHLSHNLTQRTEGLIRDALNKNKEEKNGN